MSGPDPILDHLIVTSAQGGAYLRRTAAAARAFWLACERMRLLRRYARGAA